MYVRRYPMLKFSYLVILFINYDTQGWPRNGLTGLGLGEIWWCKPNVRNAIHVKKSLQWHRSSDVTYKEIRKQFAILVSYSSLTVSAHGVSCT